MNWTDSWERLTDVDGGAQGDCFIVKRKCGDESKYFLKQLKDDGCKERRQRFCLEVIIHKTFKIPYTTTILESNTDEWEDKSVPLYYVADYISGERLDKFVNSNKLTELDVAALFCQLLKILMDCHAKGIVHRDIKPENIIIKDGRLHLVDFGIASSSIMHTVTKTGQEIGNRFLRLPEFSAGSTNKRDIRSDITLACGIALYLLSGTYPRVMQNENGKYPHQVTAVQNKLSLSENSVLWNAIFDRAFRASLSSRWSSSEEVMAILEKMNMTGITEIERMKTQLAALSATQTEEYLEQLKNDLHVVFSVLQPIVEKICDENAAGFNVQRSSWVYNRGDIVKRTEIRFHEIGNVSKFVSVVFSAELVGEQIVGYIKVNETKVEVTRASTFTEIGSFSIDSGAIEYNVLTELIKFKSA